MGGEGEGGEELRMQYSLDGSPSGYQRCQDPLYSLQCCKLYMCLVQH